MTEGSRDKQTVTLCMNSTGSNIPTYFVMQSSLVSLVHYHSTLIPGALLLISVYIPPLTEEVTYTRVLAS